MPQLMPLNWGFSSVMIFILLVMASVIYSSFNNSVYLTMLMEEGVVTNTWYW